LKCESKVTAFFNPSPGNFAPYPGSLGLLIDMPHFTSLNLASCHESESAILFIPQKPDSW